MRPARRAASAALVLLAAASTFAAPAPDATQHVHIADFAYDPSGVVIDPGDTMLWHNHDGVVHTASDDGGRWDTGPIGPDASASLVFDTPGTYTYHCSFHPTMQGSFVVSGAPNQAPSVAITSPAEEAVVNGTVHVEGTSADPDGTVSLVEVRVDSGAWQAASGTDAWAWTWDTTLVADGRRLLEARSFDGQAHSALAQRNVTVSNVPNQPPTVAIATPSDGALVEGVVRAEGTASDPEGTVARVEVRVDAGPWQAASGTTSWTFDWDTRGVPDGAHTFAARSFDGALFSTPASVSVEVDNLKPDLVVDWISIGPGLTSTTLTIRLVNVGDDLAGPFDMSISYRDGAGTLRHLATRGVPGIEPQGSGGGRVTWNTFGNLGAFDVFVIADAGGVIREHREDNNVGSERVCLPTDATLLCALPGMCRYDLMVAVLDQCAEG